jgi:hypothetical protein
VKACFKLGNDPDLNEVEEKTSRFFEFLISVSKEISCPRRISMGASEKCNDEIDGTFHGYDGESFSAFAATH